MRKLVPYRGPRRSARPPSIHRMTGTTTRFTGTPNPGPGHPPVCGGLRILLGGREFAPGAGSGGRHVAAVNWAPKHCGEEYCSHQEWFCVDFYQWSHQAQNFLWDWGRARVALYRHAIPSRRFHRILRGRKHPQREIFGRAISRPRKVIHGFHKRKFVTPVAARQRLVCLPRWPRQPIGRKSPPAQGARPSKSQAISLVQQIFANLCAETRRSTIVPGLKKEDFQIFEKRTGAKGRLFFYFQRPELFTITLGLLIDTSRQRGKNRLPAEQEAATRLF